MGIDRVLEALDEPAKLSGKVVRGFGRGSSQLGFPTANLEIRWDAATTTIEPTTTTSTVLSPEQETVLEFAKSAQTGIYAAWARVCDGPDDGVYKVAMSVGWNPTFADLKQKTVECWLLNDFEADFYDATLKVIVLARIRDEAKFDSLDQLIAEIRADGDFCAAALDAPSPFADYKTNPFFFSSHNGIKQAPPP